MMARTSRNDLFALPLKRDAWRQAVDPQRGDALGTQRDQPFATVSLNRIGYPILVVCAILAS
jgi:hypothetical protein